MDQFIATLIACRRSGIGGIFRVPVGFANLNLAPDYPIAEWRNDRLVDREKKAFIGWLATKSPYFEDIFESPEADQFNQCEFFMNGQRLEGLGVAYLLDGIGMSIATQTVWDAQFVSILLRSLRSSDDLTAEITDREVIVRHVSSPDHVQVHVDDLNAKLAASIESGSDLWNARTQLFERLDFCESVMPQIMSLTLGAGGVLVVLRTLVEMQAYCATWTDGSFDADAIPNTSVDGPATLQQFEAERTFTRPDGTSTVFSLHIKRGRFRIYFLPDSISKRCLIGYVGPHLRTIRFR